MMIRVPVVYDEGLRVPGWLTTREISKILTELRDHRYPALWFKVTLIRRSRNGTTVRISTEIHSELSTHYGHFGAAQTRGGAYSRSRPCRHVHTDLAQALNETWPGFAYVGPRPQLRTYCACVLWRDRRWSRNLVAAPPRAKRPPVALNDGEGALYSLAYLAHKAGRDHVGLHEPAPMFEVRALLALKDSAGA
jgi:hypothetical protein